MRNVNLERWRGPRDKDILDPAAIEFRAQKRSGCSCRGCLFERQWADICSLAQLQAKQRSLPKCDDGFIYLIVVRDERQLDALETA